MSYTIKYSMHVCIRTHMWPTAVMLYIMHKRICITTRVFHYEHHAPTAPLLSRGVNALSTLPNDSHLPNGANDSSTTLQLVNLSPAAPAHTRTNLKLRLHIYMHTYLIGPTNDWRLEIDKPEKYVGNFLETEIRR